MIHTAASKETIGGECGSEGAPVGFDVSRASLQAAGSTCEGEVGDVVGQAWEKMFGFGNSTARQP